MQEPQKTQIRSLGQKDPLEEEMAAHSNILFFFHSNILAWEIPWTEELGGLQSIESQRVGPFFFFFLDPSLQVNNKTIL